MKDPADFGKDDTRLGDVLCYLLVDVVVGTSLVVGEMMTRCGESNTEPG
jgi:hypothetical protein